MRQSFHSPLSPPVPTTPLEPPKSWSIFKPYIFFSTAIISLGEALTEYLGWYPSGLNQVLVNNASGIPLAYRPAVAAAIDVAIDYALFLILARLVVMKIALPCLKTGKPAVNISPNKQESFTSPAKIEGRRLSFSPKKALDYKNIMTTAGAVGVVMGLAFLFNVCGLVRQDSADLGEDLLNCPVGTGKSLYGWVVEKILFPRVDILMAVLISFSNIYAIQGIAAASRRAWWWCTQPKRSPDSGLRKNLLDSISEEGSVGDEERGRLGSPAPVVRGANQDVLGDEVAGTGVTSARVLAGSPR